MSSLRRYPSTPIFGVGAIVVGPKGILLIRRDKDPAKGKWSIPGGVVELGEKQKDAVVREVREETGIRCHVLELIDTFDLIKYDETGRIEFHYILNHYFALALDDKIQPEQDEGEAKWFKPDALPTEEIPKSLLDLLQSVTKRIHELQSIRKNEH